MKPPLPKVLLLSTTKLFKFGLLEIVNEFKLERVICCNVVLALMVMD